MNGALLRRLLDARGGFVAPDACGDDPAAVWRDLAEIEEFGFAIERHPLLGVACVGHAERLCPDQIEHDLQTTLIGRRVSVWNKVSSTNDLAAKAAASTANDGLVVLAEEQTAGRGRRGRSWSAPPRSSVLMSILLFPRGPFAEPSWLTALGAAAVAEVVSRWAGRPARIKWPNDVRVEGKKLAGILVERGVGAVVGIGLNVNTRLEDFPENLRASSTSLRVLLGSDVDRSELVRELIRVLDSCYKASRTTDASRVNRSWRERVENLGEMVTVETPFRKLEGRLDDLDLVEGLVLQSREGDCVRLPAHHVLSITPCDGAGPLELAGRGG